MKTLLRLEEIMMFILAFAAFVHTGNLQWWWFLVLLLLPDLSIAGYLFGSKPGAFCYNMVHHKGLAILFILTGLILSVDALMITGIILFGHSSMDRIFGYGLKLKQGFKYTHLGTIGR